MKTAFGVTLLVPLMLCHALAHAQIFVCKDASGRTLTSDRPIPECADRVMRELDTRGNTKREIKPPPTAEQRRQIKAEEEQRKTDELVAAERRRIDLAIKTRYRSEADIQAARERSITPIDEKIRREKSALAEAEKQALQEQADADAIRKNNPTLPAYMQRKLDDATLSVTMAKQQLADAQTERSQMSARYDDTLKRFRELSGGTASR